MGSAADDLFDAVLREQEMRHILRTACPCHNESNWFRNDDGVMECRQCGEMVDE
ncbi:hypothetical protein KEU06_08940 [Pseudaminobacter sp. 19-2017]|uniref:Uncharacterized protein n=1 Tax=Pseudaminobacter soli (ex Zhang et al. 2022) TaxID=2831468 RepID=A0A942I2H3_9HYPH|nr:hypothetical protein [Pseudaminobacter soli]MBS3648753.1 hypothetical protein [Pseudaminobacter soli]